MTWKTVSTHKTYYTSTELLRLYNESAKTSFTTFSLAVAAVGLTTISLVLNKKLHPKIATAIVAAAAAITYWDAMNVINRYLADTTIQDGIRKMQAGGGNVLIITTTRQSWTSGSGNSNTWRTLHKTSYA